MLYSSMLFQKQQACIGYLCLWVWSSPPQDAAATQFSHLGIKSVCEHDSQRHTLVGFVGGVAKHQALIASANVLLQPTKMHALRDVRRLLLKRQKHVARLVVKPWHRHKHRHSPWIWQWVTSTSAKCKGQAEPNSLNLRIPCVKCVSFDQSL